MARALGVHARDVRIVRGFGTRDKLIEIDGLDATRVDQALEAAAGTGA
jgi:uncharacterized protein YggU (UPF0235/DUF167 family)